MYKNLKIAVAMTSFNGEKHIIEQLESIEQQEIKPDEIIIFDDNSNDNTIKKIQKFQQKSKIRIKLYCNNSNIGYIANFENAIRYADGDIIFIADQDDIWFENKIEIICNKFIETKSDLLIHDAEIFYSQKCHGGSLLINSMSLTGAEHVHGCCTAISRNLKNIILPFPNNKIFKLGHDDWINLVATVLNTKKIINTKLMYYRRHLSNISKNQIELNKINSNYLINKFYFHINKFKELKNNSEKIKDEIDLKLRLIKEVRKRLKINNNKNFEIDKIVYSKKYLIFYYYRSKISNSNLKKKLKIIMKLYFNNMYKIGSGIKSIIIDLIK